jgi:hypothetical protein
MDYRAMVAAAGAGSNQSERATANSGALITRKEGTRKMKAAVLAAILGLGAIGGGGVAVAAFAQGAGPGNGPAFGEHISGMAPEHATMHDGMFGECASTMASTGEFPHHQ